MKRSLILSTVAAMLMVVVISTGAFAAGRGPGRPNPQPIAPSAPVTAPATAAATALSDEEIAGLLFMVEEEKLAYDVYVEMYDLWGIRTFSNIAASESKHMDAVRTLLDRYGIVDPTIGNAVGVFENEELQALYNQLIEMGSQSATDAMQVGVLIEETDIADLEYHVEECEHDDIAQVYANLLRGSRNHLRAFSR